MTVALTPSLSAVSWRRRALARAPSVFVWMLVSIVAVTALAYWDEERESKAALDDFAKEQTTLAEALAATLREKLPLATTEHASRAPADLLAGIAAVERPGEVLVLVSRPGTPGLVRSGGQVARSRPLEAAMPTTRGSVRLAREEAAALGLPARTAMAGLGEADPGDGRSWGVAVVATARAERDREVRARWRLVLGVVVASGLVLAFGGFAMRKQRKELELAHELAIATLRTERDERLVRADKLATMGALATGIAHEVSTPLGVILGRAEQLAPKQPDERSRRAVLAIAEQTERIFAVIRGFLALARGGPPMLEHCEPGRLARAAIDLVEHRFEKAGVRLSSEIASELPKVACDPLLFEQVLVNLLLNACDACRDGGAVELSVDRDEGGVAFVVTDDGAGITEEAAERAIEPFFTTKPEGQGTGLGLAIANEIVKHHCGSLTLGSRPEGRGTRASVELPSADKSDHA